MRTEAQLEALLAEHRAALAACPPAEALARRARSIEDAIDLASWRNRRRGLEKLIDAEEWSLRVRREHLQKD